MTAHPDSFGRTRGVYEGEAGDPRNRAASRSDTATERSTVERAAEAAHKGFHEAWSLPEPLDLYANSPVWVAIAEALDAAGLLAAYDDPAPTTGGHEYDRRARRDGGA